MTSRHRACHRGFTLVELLVVITIIGILAGLALIGLPGVIRSVQSAAMHAELVQIGTAIEEFQKERGSYPPDGNTVVTAGAGARAAAFNSFLNKRFQQRNGGADNPNSTAQARTRLMALGTSQGIVNPSPTAGTPYQLEDIDPSEAWVLMMMGFSPDVELPLTGDGDRQRRFEFDTTRLVDDDGDGWWSYKAKYSNSPVVYFNSNTYVNGAGSVASFTDPSGLVQGQARPYGRVNSAGAFEWVAPNKFQLIMAGIDDDFGSYGGVTEMKIYSSGIADSTAAPTSVDYTPADFDNITDFSQGATLDADTEL
ncbi:type II secretion system protein [Bremerella sp. JC817]|uniref:type II secretion system protein n=1 Tax=Bremerella sp. JC817 TaxID=3231756 RepID=UPI0034578CCA